MAPLHTSPSGRAFVASWEGLELEPYNDSNGFATIGVGHLLHRSPVTASDRARFAGFTRADAMELLAHDLAGAESAVVAMVRPPIQLQHRFDALVDFTFNVGSGNLMRSTLLALLNRGVRGAPIAGELAKWDHDARGRELAGLRRRRHAEGVLWLTGVYEDA